MEQSGKELWDFLLGRGGAPARGTGLVGRLWHCFSWPWRSPGTGDRAGGTAVALFLMAVAEPRHGELGLWDGYRAVSHGRGGAPARGTGLQQQAIGAGALLGVFNWLVYRELRWLVKFF